MSGSCCARHADMISRNSRRTSSSRSGPALRARARAQHLRLALRAIEVDRAAVVRLGDADLLRKARALIDQAVDLLVDGVDAAAHVLQIRAHRRRSRERCVRAQRRALRAGRVSGGRAGAARLLPVGQRLSESIASDDARRQHAIDGANPPSSSSLERAVGVDERVGVLAARLVQQIRDVDARARRGRWRSARPCSARCGWRCARRVVFGARGSTASG